MKLLFIGEGRHDIGDPGVDAFQPRAALGTIPTLARRVCSQIADDSVALAWSEIQRFNPAARKRGLSNKVAAAALLADRKFGCVGTVAVVDCDGDSTRQAALEEGVERARTLFPRLAVAWGLAIESVEAWTLGVPDAIAAVLDIDVALVQREYPPGVAIESLSQRSGKPEHRPKDLLDSIALLKHQVDSTDFREAVAGQSDVAALASACPLGFARFVENLRQALGEHSGQ